MLPSLLKRWSYIALLYDYMALHCVKKSQTTLFQNKIPVWQRYQLLLEKIIKIKFKWFKNQHACVYSK
jgi:hypothetical protein